MTTARIIQKQVTRPTSVAIMLVLFQGFQLLYPDKLTPEWENWTYNAITVVGATGLIDKIWQNRHWLFNKVKNVFKKGGKNEKLERGSNQNS